MEEDGGNGSKGQPAGELTTGSSVHQRDSGGEAEEPRNERTKAMLNMAQVLLELTKAREKSSDDDDEEEEDEKIVCGLPKQQQDQEATESTEATDAMTIPGPDEGIPGAYLVAFDRSGNMTITVPDETDHTDNDDLHYDNEPQQPNDSPYIDRNDLPTTTNGTVDPELGLVSAKPVDDLPEGRVEAQRANTDDDDRADASADWYPWEDLWERWETCGATIALVVLLAAVLLFIWSPSISEGQHTRGAFRPNQMPIPRGDYLLSLLPEYTIEAIGLYNNASAGSTSTNFTNSSAPYGAFTKVSPQALAFNWTIHDPSFDSQEPWELVERFALACFYYSTGGDTSWKSNDHWLSYDVNETDWFSSYILNDWFPWHNLYRYGFFEETPEREYELNHLWLINNNLTGTIPPELSLLTSLRTIDLTANPLLQGTIPSQIGSLERLEIMIFANNSLTGELSTELGQLSTLNSLKTQDNSFNSTIPTEIITRLQDVVVLDLASSGLWGSIPSELGQISPLGIWLEDNMLESTIPTELGLTAAQLLNLHGNLLTGTIPSEVGNLLLDPVLYKGKYEKLLRQKVPTLTGEKLEYFRDMVVKLLDVGFNGILMHQNLLTGTIPSEMGRFAEGEVINLANNLLSGSIPSELGKLSDLVWLVLSDNMLTGSLPHELGSLVTNGSLVGLSINSTEITGIIPPELCKLGKWNSSSSKGLSFDCHSGLCGCAWCPCST